MGVPPGLYRPVTAGVIRPPPGYVPPQRLAGLAPHPAPLSQPPATSGQPTAAARLPGLADGFWPPQVAMNGGPPPPGASAGAQELARLNYRLVAFVTDT